MKKPTPEEIKIAKTTLSQAGYCMEALWTEFDIIERAKERKIRLTKKQTQGIILLIGKRHDAETGVNWDFIDLVTDEFLKN